MELLSIDLIRNYAADLLGFTACAATLLTFAQRRMWPMRVFAIAANIFFIGYGALGLLYPVLLLHLVLLPLNMARLIQLVQQDREPRTTGPKQSGLPLHHASPFQWRTMARQCWQPEHQVVDLESSWFSTPVSPSM